MADIPHAVLSEHLEEQLRGRRLVAAVFLTFRFDPGFFEEQLLPVFLNVPVSHATAIKLVQLEEALKTVSDGIAVYYDQNGLVPEAGSGRLDVRRIAVRHRTGIFHPKNVFALVEEAVPDDDGTIGTISGLSPRDPARLNGTLVIGRRGGSHAAGAPQPPHRTHDRPLR